MGKVGGTIWSVDASVLARGDFTRARRKGGKGAEGRKEVKGSTFTQLSAKIEV